MCRPGPPKHWPGRSVRQPALWGKDPSPNMMGQTHASSVKVMMAFQLLFVEPVAKGCSWVLSPWILFQMGKMHKTAVTVSSQRSPSLFFLACEVLTCHQQVACLWIAVRFFDLPCLGLACSPRAASTLPSSGPTLRCRTLYHAQITSVVSSMLL